MQPCYIDITINEAAMNTNINHEYQSLRSIRFILRAYHIPSSEARQIARDLRHVIEAYELCDRDAALACNSYITSKYPMIYEIAPRYGLRPMSGIDMLERSTNELQHMLYGLSIFLYDRLRLLAAMSKTDITP